MAMMVIKMTNLSNSILRGVFYFFSPEERSAICPSVVKSPVLMTTPFPYPSLHSVPKNARFDVSR